MTAALCGFIIAAAGMFVLGWKMGPRWFEPEEGENASLSEVRDVILQCHDKSEAQEKAMLSSILDLTDVEVYDVMNHRKNLFSLDIDLPFEEILEKVKILSGLSVSKPCLKKRWKNRGIIKKLKLKT